MHVSVCSAAVGTNVHASWHKLEGAVILHATRNSIVCHGGRQAQAHLSHPADAAGINISCQRPIVQWARAWSNAGSARSWFCGKGSGQKLLPPGAGDAQHQVKLDLDAKSCKSQHQFPQNPRRSGPGLTHVIHNSWECSH